MTDDDKPFMTPSVTDLTGNPLPGFTVIGWATYSGTELHEFLENGDRIVQRIWEREMPIK